MQTVVVIQSGDNHRGIAYQYGASVEDIRQVNQGVDLSIIYPGQEIVVRWLPPP
jgi:LysM repeat protein